MSINDGSAEYTLKTNASLNDISNSQNDIMNIIGYRQKNKVYNRHDIVYNQSLPPTYYLKCLQEGTTSSNELIVQNPVTSNIVNDGTVIWMINSPTTLAGEQYHNSIYRGSNLTEYFNSGQMSIDINKRNFSNIFIGDFIYKHIDIPEITYTGASGQSISRPAVSKDITWRVAGLNSYIYRGEINETAINKPHIVLINDNEVYKGQMNSIDSTENGFIGTDFYKFILPEINTSIKTSFGENHVLKYRDKLSSHVNLTKPTMYDSSILGYTDASTWVDVEANVPNTVTILGYPLLASSFEDYSGICNMQLPLFNFYPHLINSFYSWSNTITSMGTFTFFTGVGNVMRTTSTWNAIGFKLFFLLV